MVNIKFVKPQYLRKHKHPSTQHSVQSKIIKFISPHDSPKATKKDWTDGLFQLIPNACLYTIVQGPDPSASPDDVAFYMPVYSCFIFIVVLSPCIVTTTSDIGTSVVTTTAHLTSIRDTITSNIPVTTISDHPMTTLSDSIIYIPSSIALPVDSVPIPKALTELYDENYQLLNKEDLLRKAVEVFRSISFSESECKAIEASTRLQRNSEEWIIQRRGRITASSFHDVYVLKDGTSCVSDY